jgi:hypothetical protein
MKIDHLLRLSDDTGILQHAIYSVPDRSHGYCLDDVARGLLVSLGRRRLRPEPALDAATHRYCGFIQHAWSPQSGRFRNFMSYDRCWLEDVGSQDSQGRALWALGVAADDRSIPTRADWASKLFAQAVGCAEGFCAPRAMSFALLGLDGFLAEGRIDERIQALRLTLVGRLMGLYDRVAAVDWCWFEEGLSYDNARLPQALLATGRAIKSESVIAAGVRTLEWLCRLQSAPSGRFRPVGTYGFYDRRQRPSAFDQQPLEAAATIAACLVAHVATEEAIWLTEAHRAFAWFHGANDLGLALVDLTDGSCRDGLHPDRVNENRGAESTLSYLLAETDMLAVAGCEAAAAIGVRSRA